MLDYRSKVQVHEEVDIGVVKVTIVGYLRQDDHHGEVLVVL